MLMITTAFQHAIGCGTLSLMLQLIATYSLFTAVLVVYGAQV